MRGWVGTLVAVLATGILAGGCGGDEGAATVRQLNAICQAHNRKAAAEILQVYDDPRVKRANSKREAISLEANLLFPILLVDAEAQARAIRSSHVPSSDEEQVNAILAAYRGWINRVKQAPLKAVVANDVYNEARELAGSYGLPKCGLNPFEVRTYPDAARARQTG